VKPSSLQIEFAVISWIFRPSEKKPCSQTIFCFIEELLSRLLKKQGHSYFCALVISQTGRVSSSIDPFTDTLLVHPDCLPSHFKKENWVRMGSTKLAWCNCINAMFLWCTGKVFPLHTSGSSMYSSGDIWRNSEGRAGSEGRVGGERGQKSGQQHWRWRRTTVRPARVVRPVGR
jgi:hypothetical protein